MKSFLQICLEFVGLTFFFSFSVSKDRAKFLAKQVKALFNSELLVSTFVSYVSFV